MDKERWGCFGQEDVQVGKGMAYCWACNFMPQSSQPCSLQLHSKPARSRNFLMERHKGPLTVQVTVGQVIEPLCVNTYHIFLLGLSWE